MAKAIDKKLLAEQKTESDDSSVDCEKMVMKQALE